MRDNRCFICKYRQNDILKSNDDLIFDAKGNSMAIPLCYSHSVELFKNGQKNFLLKHRNIFAGNFGVENDLELMSYFSTERSDRSWY